MYKYLMVTLATLAGINAIAETEIPQSRSMILSKVIVDVDYNYLKAGKFETLDGSSVVIKCYLETAGWQTGNNFFILGDNDQEIHKELNKSDCSQTISDILKRVKEGSQVKLTFSSGEKMVVENQP